MKKFLLFIVVISLFLASCDLSDSSGDTSDGVPPINISTDNTAKIDIRSTLQNLPELRQVLPGSLKADSAELTRVAPVSNAVIVDGATLSPIKSQTWFELQTTSNFVIEIFQTYLDKIKVYANSNEIDFSKKYTIDFTDLEILELFGFSSVDGVVNSTTFKTENNNDLEYQIFFKSNTSIIYGENEFKLDITTQINVENDFIHNTQKVKMYSYVNQKMINSSSTNETIIPCYIEYFTGDGDSVVYYDLINNDKLGNSVVYIHDVDENGFIQNFNTQYNSLGEITCISTNVGNDNYGATSKQVSDLVDQDGDGTPEIHNRCFFEYYDSEGSVIRSDHGEDYIGSVIIPTNSYNIKNLGFSTAPDTVNVEEFPNTVNEVNYIYSKVEDSNNNWKIVKRSHFDSETSEYIFEVTTDNGSTWNSTDPNFDNNYYFKATDSDIWEFGDTIYFVDSSSYSENSVNSILYTKFYTVPQSENHFGYDYYMTKDYPLNRILPMTTEYSNMFNLVEEEGETFTWEWTKWDGKTVTTSYTDYTYYLNNLNVDRNGDGIIDSTDVENNITYESNYDIDLSQYINVCDSYYYSGESCTKTKGYYLKTNGELPKYFTFSYQSDIDSVYNMIIDATQSANDYNRNIHDDQITFIKGNIKDLSF